MNFQSLTAALALLVVASAAIAQDYPSKPIRLTVGFPPGGNVDLVARLVALKMSENMKQQVVVDNRALIQGGFSPRSCATAGDNPATFPMLMLLLIGAALVVVDQGI